MSNPTLLGNTVAPYADIGVCMPSDPRIDADSRARCVNVARMVAETLSENLRRPDGTPATVVWSDVLIDGALQADQVARQFKAAGVQSVVTCPDTWAFPQNTMITFLNQFGRDMPVNIVCGNSGPKPGVVYAQALNGALAQAGRLSHLIVGTWPDTGLNPVMTVGTAEDLLDWAYAAVTTTFYRGKRVVLFGTDSMGMETAMAHRLASRRNFNIDVAQIEMLTLADRLAKFEYDTEEHGRLVEFIMRQLGDRIEIRNADDRQRFEDGLAMYLIMRDLLAEYGAVPGGFMNQLAWASDSSGLPRPIADMAESLFNTTFDHNGPKPPVPFGTESDFQAVLTMMAFQGLSGGEPQLFMDFRKVWEAWEVRKLAEVLGVELQDEPWAAKGFFDGDNSGSASLDYAAQKGATVEQIMEAVSMPQADPGYFPGGGNSVTYVSPAGIKGVVGRLAFSDLTGMYSLVWDTMTSVRPPEVLTTAVCQASTSTWPHTLLTPNNAPLAVLKQIAPANHIHMSRGLNQRRVQYWLDLNLVQDVRPWAGSIVPGVDRVPPLIFEMNGGVVRAKELLAARR